MRRSSSSLRRTVFVPFVSILLALSISLVVVIHTPLGEDPRAFATTVPVAQLTGMGSAVSFTAATSSTAAANSRAMPTLQGGLIAIGPSRNRCLYPSFNDTGFASLQAAVAHFEAETHSDVTCLSAYLDSAQSWKQWVHPWVADKQFGYSSWVAKDPQKRQLILAVDLIPSGLAHIANPLGWEKSCASGNFDSYATQLGKHLVAAGLQNSVLRLGPEMNGRWENDFVGDTTQEQNLWAHCFGNEVTALRKAPGEHFLIDWNPNACVNPIPYSHFYPGNAYVDILGLDLFDQSCIAPQTPYSFQQLANEPASLTKFEAFAAVVKKPMSFPEWGYLHGPIKDDPGYFNGIGSTVTHQNFAFETYFDYQTPHPQLGLNTPLSLAAFRKWFGTTASKS